MSRAGTTISTRSEDMCPRMPRAWTLAGEVHRESWAQYREPGGVRPEKVSRGVNDIALFVGTHCTDPWQEQRLFWTARFAQHKAIARRATASLPPRAGDPCDVGPGRRSSPQPSWAAMSVAPRSTFGTSHSTGFPELFCNLVGGGGGAQARDARKPSWATMSHNRSVDGLTR